MGQKAEVAAIVIPLLIFIPVALVALFCLISFIISRGGWNRLAGRFESRAVPSGTSFYRVLGKVGTSTYKGSMKVVVTTAGLFIDVSPVFRVGHRPLFIPFGAMHDARHAQMFRKDYLIVTVDAGRAVTIALPAELWAGTPLALPR